MSHASAPQSVEPGEAAMTGFEALLGVLDRSRRRAVLTGAGCSTESGIPDYRDAQGAWKHPPPMQYQEFVGSPAARQRYWARALIGWRRFRDVRPNRAHQILAGFERAGRLRGLITQNVDGLHQRAGSMQVIDLHGRIDKVDCLHCHASFDRDSIQTRLAQLNPSWVQLDAETAPDGDALLSGIDFSSFQPASCEHCRGVLKPAVVFFGERVPPERVERAYAALSDADALLIVGSSLMVFSGYRFVRAARERQLPVAIINLGRTRADADVNIKVTAACGEVLERLEARLSARVPTA